MSHPVCPPAQGAWYDLDAVVTNVLARLRLKAGDVDVARIRELVPVAAGHINNELDRVTPMSPVVIQDQPDTMVTPTILEALERVVVELYGRGRANLRDDGIPVLDVAGVIETVLDDISPHKCRWGIA